MARFPNYKMLAFRPRIGPQACVHCSLGRLPERIEGQTKSSKREQLIFRVGKAKVPTAE
jgi:hypothetical protein